MVVDSMPSSEHEGCVELVRQQPELATKLLRDQLGVKLPSHEHVRAEPADLNDLTPTEYRADAVVTLRETTGDTPVLGVVICPNAAAARWCDHPIELGHPGLVLHPLVLGPDRVPMVTNIDQVRGAPELAVLSAVAWGGHPDHVKILDALTAVWATIDQDQAVRYSEILLAALPEAARRHWEERMTSQTFEFQSAYARRLRAEGKAEGKTEGKAEGMAEAVLRLLAVRGVAVPDDARARITACTDLDQLDIWVGRAAIARTVDDLFD